MKHKSINLVLPGLFNSFQKSELDAANFSEPSLIQSFISKSNYISDESNLNMGLSVDYVATYPLAYYENSEDIHTDHTMFYADPISIEVKSDHIVAYPVSIDRVDRLKLEIIIDRFNQHFLPDGLSLKCLSSGRIVCLSTVKKAPEMIPAYSMYGRDVKHFLPQGDDAKFWLRVFNEVQMFLHEYIEEAGRVFDNQLLNGFWFWGNGKEFNSEFNDDAFISESQWLKGFCALNKFKQYAIPDIVNCEEERFHIVDESLLLASSCGDVELWKEGLKKVESEILRPLYSLLKRGEIKEINIQDSSRSFYQLKNIHRYRVFRKNIPLSQVCVIEE